MANGEWERIMCDWSIAETTFWGGPPGRSARVFFLGLGRGPTNSTEKSIVEVPRSELYVIGRLQKLVFGVVPGAERSRFFFFARRRRDEFDGKSGENR